MSAIDDMELVLTASGYVTGEWSAREVAAIVVVSEIGRHADALARIRHLVTTGSIAAPVLTDHDKGYNAALSDVFSAMNGWDA